MRGYFSKIAKSRWWKACAACVLSAAAVLPVAACAKSAKFEDLPFLKVEGEYVKDEDGNEVYLRGVNAGGLGVIEQWMNGFASSSSDESSIRCIDHKTTTQVFIDRFGMTKTKELWKEYQSNWWKEEDFQNCKEMGMNVIRLPFTYMNVDYDAVLDLYDAGKSYDFTFLDEFVNKAAEYGLYTILDLHGAYGSQNGKDHSGEVLDASAVDFYSNEELQGLTIKLWEAVAEHFKDNPNVAAYDLLNEPAETTSSGGTQLTTERHFIVYDKIYEAIRKIDENHIIIFESCWDAANLPRPETYGWENCMYSIHHYSGCTGEERYAEHCATVDKKINDMKQTAFGVPVYMGEFTCYDSEEQWRYTLETMNENGWHWTSWTYKINNSSRNTFWGVFNVTVSGDLKVNAHYDSYEEILEKFSLLQTTDSTHRSTFASGTTLWDVITEYCEWQPEEKTETV